MIGESNSVPFVTAFVKKSLGDGDRKKITDALLSVGSDANLLVALETSTGFVQYDPKDNSFAESSKKN